MQVVHPIFDTNIMPYINHTNAEVRKNIVFCLVEINMCLDPAVFEPLYQQLPLSQQKLVSIYSEKRLQQTN